MRYWHARRPLQLTVSVAEGVAYETNELDAAASLDCNRPCGINAPISSPRAAPVLAES